MAKYLVLIFSICGAIFAFTMCTGHEQLEYESVELDYKFSFPKDSDEIFLSIPVNIAFSNDLIFIPDQAASVVYQFDTDGNYIQSVGQPGRGPGELLVPGIAEFHNTQLIVYDIGNARFVNYDIQSNEYDTYQIRDIPRSIAISDTNIFMTHLISAGLDYHEQFPLITVYDLKFNQTHSFGRLLSNKTPNMLASGSAAYIRINEDRLYVLFMYYPILKIYDLTGNLKLSIEFDSYKKLIEKNYEASTYNDPSYIPLRTLFSAFDVNEKGIFAALRDGNEIYFDQYNHNGDFKMRYKKSVEEESQYVIWDMNISVNNKDSMQFYILNIDSDVPKVDVYGFN